MELWHGTEDWEAAQEELAAAGLTDGLPVVPPTPARVERMLALHGYAADEIVIELPPLFNEATWQNIAINAVMAGCRPEYLPVVGAAVEALAAPEFNLTGIATTTGSATPLIIVNGPIAQAIGMNAVGNALGPGNRANATIGRAVSLVLRNVGGAIPGELDMATLGQPGKYTFCLAENESASPWSALHVERGFAPDASVVTVVGAAGIVEVVDSASHTAEDLAQTFAQSMLIAGNIGGGGHFGGGEPLILMPPEHAATFQRGGFNKEKVKAAIYGRAVLPSALLSSAVREQLNRRSTDASAGDMVRIAKQAEDVMIVVAGGVGVKAAYVPTWGGITRAVSRQIRDGRGIR